MGVRRAGIAVNIIILVGSYIRQHKLGIKSTSADGPVRLFPAGLGSLISPFCSWDRLPGRKWPMVPIPHLAPDLVVEVLSKSNTRPEMERKLKEYFEAGVRMVWMVDPKKRTVRVYTAIDQSILLDERQSLDGGTILPGFVLSLKDVFAKNTSHEERARRSQNNLNGFFHEPDWASD